MDYDAAMRPVDRIICLAGGVTLLAACRTPGTGSPSAAPPGAPVRNAGALVVNTDRGPLAGKALDGGGRAFLGVPFAAPPTGALRWRPPADVTSWTAPRDATAVGPACPQLSVPPYARADEDCLTLNVWTPPGAAALKPVLVWIPGGGFGEGSGGYQLYDGARLAAREDAVVVTMNYRLGPLGFMAHPLLARELGRTASPSYGLLDQRAALGWVQRNIRAFGGDPGSVTVFGESAGAFSVCAHLAMPGSRGLFARAIMQSGACADPLYFGAREAEAQGEKVAAALGCADLACLRGKSADAVLHALPIKRRYTLSPGVWWGPVVDGTELPVVPLRALRAGAGANVPMIIGWNRDEGAAHTIGFTNMTREERDTYVRDAFGDAAVGPVAARYAGVGVKESLDSVITEGCFVCESRRAARALAARGVPVYVYELTHALENPRFHWLGATHQVDLWLVFGNEEAGIALAAAERPLSNAIMDAWGRFARTSDPSGPGLTWPRYTVDKDELLLLDDSPAVAAGTKGDICAFWDRFERPVR
jgi:para-nitrobenzyl esterase